MIRRASVVLVYLLAIILPLQVPAIASAPVDEGCGCSVNIADCCCAAPLPLTDRDGWKSCPSDGDIPACLPTLPNHPASPVAIAESADEPGTWSPSLHFPESPLPDPTDVIPRAC